jgi:hypothetical protein
MSPEREIRPTVNGTDLSLAGGSFAPSVTPTDAKPSEPVALIGSTVEAPLQAALERLRTDAINLDDLSPGLAGFYLAGHAAALASVLPELTRVETERDNAAADADRFYRAAFAPVKPIKIGPSYAELEAIRHATYYGGAE